MHEDKADDYMRPKEMRAKEHVQDPQGLSEKVFRPYFPSHMGQNNSLEARPKMVQVHKAKQRSKA